MDISPYIAAALAAICVPGFSWLIALVACEAWKHVAQIDADAEMRKFEMLLEYERQMEQEP